ncbi:MAG TPA: MFS transporter, partial [Lachnospiraceae bacterium]|nr:MFS transporter [Lachnospiraceae bacterium]
QFSVISICIAGCLVWDAINGPLMGVIIENSHLKHGKFRPWIMTGALLNAVIIVILFSVRPKGWLFVLFFGIGYLLWGMTYTMNDIAFWGMLPSLSSDPQVRNTLVTLMSIFICIGQFTVAGVLPVIVAGNAVAAYRGAAFVVALCFIGFQLLTFLGVTERPREEAKEKLSLKGMLLVFKRNDQLIPIGIASFLFNIGSNLLIVFAVNFFYFEFGYSQGGTLIFLFTVMYGLGTLFSQAAFSIISKHFSRMHILRFCTTVIAAGYLLLLSFGYVLPKNIILLNVIGFLIFFCQGLYNLVVVVMLNNTIEYDEYRFHERHDSVISAVRSFSVKFAGAVNQGLSALVLIVSGIYSISQKISGLEIEVGKQTLTQEDALVQANGYIAEVLPYQTLVLRLGMVLIPILILTGCYFLIKTKYKIDEAEYDRIVKEIEQRR